MGVGNVHLSVWLAVSIATCQSIGRRLRLLYFYTSLGGIKAAKYHYDIKVTVLWICLLPCMNLTFYPCIFDFLFLGYLLARPFCLDQIAFKRRHR